ncbi:MAG: hypothetical protein ABI760_09700 [Ferruginibacter sp.]
MQQLLNRIILKVGWILRKRPSIPGIEEKRNVIEHYRSMYKPSVFIETGTFLGDTVDLFKYKFDFIYSIELSEELASKAKVRFAHNENIKIIQGNSAEILASVVGELNSQALFWLDGHYSSEFYINGEFIKTAKGESETPVEKELDILLALFTPQIILIDDARLFTGMGDYPTFRFLKNKVQDSNNKYKIFINKDIIHIIPN